MKVPVAMLCYQHIDSDSVDLLEEELALRGLSVVRDKSTFLAGQPIQAEMRQAVDSCDAFVILLTRHSLYLDAPGRQTPALEELSRALRRREDEIDRLKGDKVADAQRRARPFILPVCLGLGDDRASAAEQVRLRTGFDPARIWSRFPNKPHPPLAQEDAASIANDVLRSVLALQESIPAPLQLGIATRGTSPANPYWTLDATRLLGVGRRPGTSDDWDRYLRALVDLFAALKAVGVRELDLPRRPEAHLTAGLAFGRVFHQTAGFQVAVEGAAASTNETANLKVDWLEGTDPGSRRAAVEIRLIAKQDLFNQAEGSLVSNAVPLRGRLQFDWQGAEVLTDQEIRAAAHACANRILERVSRHNLDTLDLFLTAPSSFAVFLGHQLTGAPPSIQLYELDASREYRPSLNLPADLP